MRRSSHSGLKIAVLVNILVRVLFLPVGNRPVALADQRFDLRAEQHIIAEIQRLVARQG